jgi:transcriptional regulator with XRE-family HTH domain
MAKSLDLGWLREELRKPGKSQTGLAQHLGVHVSAVNKILSGTRSVKLEEYEKILEYVNPNRSIDEVLDRIDGRGSSPHEASIAATSLTDVDWALNRFVEHPPIDLSRFNDATLKALVAGDEKSLIQICFQAIMEELSKTIVLLMRSYNERYAAKLSEFLQNYDLAISLGRGLALLDEDDARRTKALSSAFSLSLEELNDETSRLYNRQVHRAAAAHSADSEESRAVKLVKFTSRLLEQLVSAQTKRRDAAQDFFGRAERELESLDLLSTNENNRKSKSQVDV